MDIFIKKWSEMSGGRFDPKFLNYTNKICTKFPITFLNNLLKSTPMYGANEAGIPRTSETQPRYIRITDIDDFGCLKDGLGATAQTIQSQYLLEENDILFARSGTVGKTYIHRNIGYKSFFAGYMIKFRVDSSKILPYFVFLYTQLDIYKEWVKAIQRTSVQPNINAEEYKNLLIPIPPKEIQHQIIDIMDNAYLLKAQKENEAKNILDSIDSYILDELGIALLSKDTDLRHRIYTTKLSSISGKRFDCEYHQIYYKNLKNAIMHGKYNLSTLGKITNTIKTGTTPHVSLNPFIEKSSIIFLRNSNLQKGEIILDNVRYVKEYLRDKLIYSNMNEVIICIAGTIGLSAVNNIGKIAINQNVSSLNLKEVANPYFVAYWLNSKISLEFFNREASVATILYINNNILLGIPIPLPPIEIQQKIVDEINERKKKSLNLQKEAKDILQSATTQVERILLGKQ